jgi:uncharacterized protein
MPRILFGLLIFFQGFAALALDVPKLKDRVTDLAGILTPDQITRLNAKLRELERTDSTQVAVLIIPSLEEESLEDYSLRVVDAWKLGKKGQDNGLLILIAKKEQKIRFDIGIGLEANLTDTRARIIRETEMVPRFRAGDFYGGIDAGLNGIIQMIHGVYEATPAPAVRHKSAARPRLSMSGGLVNLIIILLFPLFWILTKAGKWGAPIIGAGAGMLFPFAFFTHALPLLLIGGAVGSLAGLFIGRMIHSGNGHSDGSGGTFFGGFGGGGGDFGGGGGDFSGGGGFDGGGFSGGGGDFGGGGSSGSW